MKMPAFIKSLIFIALSMTVIVNDMYAGEYPETLTAYLGTTPALDGYISEGEYDDAEMITGMTGFQSDTAPASSDADDLSAKIWYKHDGTNLFFAFDVTDDIIYGLDTTKWTPDSHPNANEMHYSDGGLCFFSDGIEIMMNPTYVWDDNSRCAGDGAGWQMILNTHKSTLGGKEAGGLIEGVPFSEYAWDHYNDWIVNEDMKASIRFKSEEEGRGFIVEWRISPNPCMEISSGNFLDLTQETRVGINLEFQDLDNKSDGPDTFFNFNHVDYLAKVDGFRKSWTKSFATLLITPDVKLPPGETFPMGTTIACSGQSPRIAFAAIVGESYEVQYTDSLINLDWQPLQVFQTVTTNWIEATDPSSTNRTRYYRILWDY